MVSVETQTDHRAHTKTTTFYVGDSSDESDPEDIEVMGVTSTETETQTEESMILELQAESRPPRPLQECVAILKSTVRLRFSPFIIEVIDLSLDFPGN